MVIWARIEDSTVVEIIAHPENPTSLFPPEWIWVEAPAEARQGSTFEDGVWTHPEVVDPEPEPDPKPARRTLVTPPEFKMLFTGIERVMIRQFRARTDDPDQAIQMAALVVDDWFAIIDDPRLQYVNLALPQTQDGVRGIVPLGLLTAERAEEILAGVAD